MLKYRLIYKFNGYHYEFSFCRLILMCLAVYIINYIFDLIHGCEVMKGVRGMTNDMLTTVAWIIIREAVEECL